MRDLVPEGGKEKSAIQTWCQTRRGMKEQTLFCDACGHKISEFSGLTSVGFCSWALH